MKIRYFANRCGPEGPTIVAGMIVEVDDALARVLIETHQAEAVTAKAAPEVTQGPALEVASVKPPEAAVIPQAEDKLAE